MSKFLTVLCCLCCICLPTANQAGASQPKFTIDQAELLSRTQQLYDAIAVGNRVPWNLYFADDAMFYDEKGRAMNKKALLEDVQPLPSGYSGVIRVVHPHTTFAPGVAAFAYDLDETETVFGQEMHARYHTVDTWLRRGGKWQIAVSQAMRYYEDPAVGQTDTTHLDDFTGIYELSSGNRRTVTRMAGDLFLQRGEETKAKLLPESGDLFFRSGVEGRILFHRNVDGTVDALYDRRNNEDVIWRKVR